MAGFVAVGKVSDIQPGSGRTVSCGGKNVAVFNVSGTFYAIDDTCLHRGGPLGEGELQDIVVTCPWHGWQYDVTSGANIRNPAVRVACYPVRVEGDEVQVSC